MEDCRVPRQRPITGQAGLGPPAGAAAARLGSLFLAAGKIYFNNAHVEINEEKISEGSIKEFLQPYINFGGKINKERVYGYYINEVLKPGAKFDDFASTGEARFATLDVKLHMAVTAVIKEGSNC